MNQTREVLISVKTFSDQNLTVMKSVVRAISAYVDIVKVSSIYRVDRAAESLVSLRDIRKEEHLECFATVLLINALDEPKKLLERFQDVEKLHQKEYLHRSVSINLLMCDRDVIMLPGLSVPHPEMHLRPEEIVLSTEVAADFLHPVLNENLAELARKYAGAKWGEFFAQGLSLLES